MHIPNRRKFHRIDYNATVHVKISGDNAASGKAKNLSLTGIFVRGNFDNESEMHCQISFVQEGKSETGSLEAEGKVIWGNEQGVGIQFTSMKFNNYMSLVAALINNAEQPAIILSEIPQTCPFKITDE